jgi:hypothetical protein
MMKRFTMCFLLVSCTPLLFAGYTDGFITAGEYEYGVTWRSFNSPLIVDGGGADQISVRDNGCLIVKSTSTPLAPGWDGHPGGVYDILLFNTAHLEYLNGVTELISVSANGLIYNTADLKGGSINYLQSMQYPIMTGVGPHINIYCLPGYSWINNNPLLGVQGQWWDDSPFRIQFINDSDYDPTWTNINFITPEPATLLLLGLGGFLIRQKR